jgi:hypothetical protein
MMDAMRAFREPLNAVARIGGVTALRAIVLAFCISAFAIAASPAAAELPDRAEYVAKLEGICEPGSNATELAVQGARGDVRAERLRVASMKFAQAKRIFARTVREISSVPRPPADAKTLARWFTHLARENFYLGRIAADLRTENLPRFQRVLAEFFHQGNQANNAVISFGFDYCSFKPSRFE